jgi:hypothetical protein
MKVVRKAKLAIYDGYSTHWTNPKTEFQESASHSGSLKTRNNHGFTIVEGMLRKLIKRGVRPGTKITISIETSE